MSRKIFKASETKQISSKVLITPPHIIKKEEPETIEKIKETEHVAEEKEIQPEVEKEKLSVEEERNKLLEEAKKLKEEAESEAARIKEEAEKAAFKVMQKQSTEARKAKEDAEAEAEKIVKEAEQKANSIEEQSKKKAIAYITDMKKKAINEGREEGFKKGEEEVKHLIERLHVILNAAIDKRKEIIESTERQLIDLVLLISKKVVKVISEKARAVVIANVKEALKKVGTDTEIIIKVNTADLEITTKHKQSFISQVETLKKVSIEEDSRVDPGGCIIETSFGDIDARIQRQLALIDERIRELLPI
ncbi:MAG: flagellar assembly protein FliH [Spirochaetota bacterium]|nr:MAG: flagellar assembly protein FliH [Spirochaetota bacterium]